MPARNPYTTTLLLIKFIDLISAHLALRWETDAKAHSEYLGFWVSVRTVPRGGDIGGGPKARGNEINATMPIHAYSIVLASPLPRPPKLATTQRANERSPRNCMFIYISLADLRFGDCERSTLYENTHYSYFLSKFITRFLFELKNFNLANFS